MRNVPLAIAVLISTCAISFAQSNIVPDGGFEKGVAAWGYHQQDGAQGSVVAVHADGAQGAKAARITVTTAGKPHYIQFWRAFPTSAVQPPSVYRFSLLARADRKRPFSVRLMGSRRPWNSAGLSADLEATTKWRRMEMLFRARDPSQEQIRIDFFLGEQTGTVWLDDVRIEPVELSEPQEPAGPSLDGANWRLRFSENGSIMRLDHKPTNRRLVGGVEKRDAYRLTLLRDGRERTLSSSDAEAVTGSRTEGRREFTFDHGDLRVTCITASPDGQSIQFTARLDNDGDGAVIGFEYPILHCPAQLGDASADDAVLYPRCDGGLIEDPLATMGGGHLDDTYPGPLSCQLMAYYDDAAGLYLATHDSSGHPKRFNCRMGVDLELSVTHLSANVPGDDLQLQYPTVLRTFVGDWYDAAEIYRNWSRQQPWCRTTVAERSDAPEWLRDGAMVTCYNPRATLEDGSRRFSPEGLRDFLRMLKADYGLPVVPNNRGWERYGTWTGQEYFPPFPSPDAFERDARIIAQEGGAGMIMLSGYRWTIQKPLPGGGTYSSAERFEREVSPWVTHEPDGQTPRVFTSDRKNDFRGEKYARLCPATEFAKNTVLDAAVRCVSAGYPVIHFDQEVSGPASTSLCGSRDHGHPPGYGPWMYNAMADLYRRIRAACEPLDERFALSMEEPNELFLPWLNLCQSRPNGLTNAFPIRKPMTRVVPLFSFLYHDYLVGWVAFYPWRSAGHPMYTIAKGFSAGMMPGLHWESTQRWPQQQRQAFNTMLRNCNEMYAGPGRESLIFGKMLKPLDLDVPTREFDIAGVPKKVRIPAVWNSVWELPDGRKSIILINPEQQQHRVTVPRRDTAITVPALDAVVVGL